MDVFICIEWESEISRDKWSPKMHVETHSNARCELPYFPIAIVSLKMHVNETNEQGLGFYWPWYSRDVTLRLQWPFRSEGCIEAVTVTITLAGNTDILDRACGDATHNSQTLRTRHETRRWLATTTTRHHQRFFSQASKKTTPQNMWRRMMAMVMKAAK